MQEQRHEHLWVRAHHPMHKLGPHKFSKSPKDIVLATVYLKWALRPNRIGILETRRQVTLTYILHIIAYELCDLSKIIYTYTHTHIYIYKHADVHLCLLSQVPSAGGRACKREQSPK